MKSISAIWAGKIAKTLSILRGGSGSAVPGVVALKIDPHILGYLAKQIPSIILVTGTNGKTTTSSLLAGMLRGSGKKVLCNAEGANMITGVTSAMINQADFRGKLNFDIAVLEVDEASLPKITKQLKPDAVIVTNFFRDQLDRFGEIDVLISYLSEAIKKTQAKLFLNTDDPFVMRLDDLGLEAVYYGLQENAYAFSPYGMSESKYCPRCQRELKYDTLHYGQLGIYACQCGFGRKKPNYELQKMETRAQGYDLLLQGKTYHLNLQGAYNGYNALAAISCAKEFGVNDDIISKTLASYNSGNGRMQKLNVQGKAVTLNLIKNPAGANVTLSEIQRDDVSKQIVIFLNDLAADGKDISWIWDVDFEKLTSSNVYRIICAGRRAEDMALRLKYAGFHEERLLVIPSVEGAIDEALQYNLPNYFIPTYTNLEVVSKHLKELGT